MSFPHGRFVDSPPCPPNCGVPEDGVLKDGVPEDGVPHDRVLKDGVPNDRATRIGASYQSYQRVLERWRRDGRPLKGLSLNRGDVLLLLAGIVAFFMLTFLPGIVDPGNTPGRTGPQATAPYSRSADAGMPGYAVPPDTFPWSGKGSPTAAPAAQEPPPILPSYPPAAAPTRIVYPAAGLDVVIHPLTPTREELESQAIVPPITVDGYWVSDFGMPGAGSTNTTYILGHSWEGRDAPFNRLSALSAPGDIFEATTASGTMRYRVDSVDTYVKASLKDSPIWTAVPNRLVLISCYTEDPWGKNVVVVASPVPDP